MINNNNKKTKQNKKKQKNNNNNNNNNNNKNNTKARAARRALTKTASVGKLDAASRPTGCILPPWMTRYSCTRWCF